MDMRGCAPRSRSVGAYVQSLWSSGRPTRLSLGSLSLVEDLTLKRGLGHPYTNWSGSGADPLTSPRQGETSRCLAVHGETSLRPSALWCVVGKRTTWGCRVRGRTPCFGGGECHVPLSGVSSWATLVVKLHGYAGLRSKIKECRGIRAVPLEFRQADPVEFGELVAGRGLNAEEGTRPSLHKLVGVWSRSPDEPKAGRNQSLPRLIRLAPWHGSAAWAKCGGRKARPVTNGIRAASTIAVRWSPSAHACHRVPRVESPAPCLLDPFLTGTPLWERDDTRERLACHVPLSGVSSWATLVVKLHGYAGLRSKIKECRGIRAVPLEFRQADPVEFGELVAGRGLNAEEGTRPSLHKLVGVWSRSPDEPKAGRNQSLPRLIRLAPWHGSAAWAKCGGRKARPVTNGIRAASTIAVRWSPSAHACHRVPRVESP
ncbi:hypothetical protein ACLB2K_007046 [Fragaria x ananassa]